MNWSVSRKSESKPSLMLDIYVCICTNYSAIYVSWFNKIRLHFSKLLLKQNCEINSLCLLHFVCFSELRTKVRRSNWKISYMHKQIARVERYIDITYILYIYIYTYLSSVEYARWSRNFENYIHIADNEPLCLLHPHSNNWIEGRQSCEALDSIGHI